MPNVSLDTLREQPVMHIVSLGPRCATTYNLRRHYNFATAYPFDWWISPAGGLIQILTKLDARDRIQLVIIAYQSELARGEALVPERCG